MVSTAVEMNDEFSVTLMNVEPEFTDPGQRVLERLRLDGGENSGGGQCRVEGKEISSITGNVGGSHRSSRQYICSTVVPGGDSIGS